MTKGHAEPDDTQDETIGVRVRRPVGAVLSVRVPRDLVLAVEAYAMDHGLSMSEVVRDAVEQFVAFPALPSTPTLYASINTYANVVLTSAEAQVHRPTRGQAQTVNERQSGLAIAG
jgi:hypothetical protein